MKIDKQLMALSLVAVLTASPAENVLDMFSQETSGSVSAATTGVGASGVSISSGTTGVVSASGVSISSGTNNTQQEQPLITSRLKYADRYMYGTASPGAKVEVWIDNKLAKTVTANEGGLWTVTGIDVYEQQVVKVKSILNNSVKESPNYTIWLIETPVVTSLVTDGATSVFGTADSGIQIQVWVDGALVKTVYANESGYWTASVPTLTTGHKVQIRARLFDSDPWYKDSSVYTVAPTTNKQIQPLITSEVIAGETSVSGIATPGAKVDVWVSDSFIKSVTASATGAWSAKVPVLRHQARVQVRATFGGQYKDSPSCLAATRVAKPTITVATEKQTTISGTATPGSTVAVYAFYQGLIATVIAKENGQWTATVPALLSHGTTFVRSTIPGIYDRYVESDDFGIRTVPTVTSTLNAGNNRVGGMATAGSLVDIWQSGIKIGSTHADNMGRWEATTSGLISGTVVYVRATTPEDGAVLESGLYNVFLKFVDPVVTGGASAGSTAVVGRGTPGATIEVLINNKSYSTTVNNTGEWSVPVPGLKKGDILQIKARLGNDTYTSLIYPIPDGGRYTLVAPDINGYHLGSAYITGTIVDPRATTVKLYNGAGVLLRSGTINENRTYQIYASDKFGKAGEEFKVSVFDGKEESLLVSSKVLP
ncbi:Ig-like domain-containing protein [Listeria grandensis]|uniref:Ig-like domain-containing protein n=1 Tax=Listeria grandensis TaxID=1494963 RepID=UPI00164DCD68|nr:Ig-like domain-containing protein [Listeria grandensis]MBC6315507.1 hypothetical protein [Listeria grandensis]